MRKFSFLAFNLFLLFQASNGQTIIGGVFFTDTTLTVSNSPYHVTSNVLVPIGVSVKIEQGVKLFFDQNITFQVEGELQAIGTIGDSITFQVQTGSSGTWKGFTFANSAIPYDGSNGTGCIFAYCIFSKAENAIWAASGVSVLHSEIKNCGGGILAYGDNVFIQYTRIHDGSYFAITTWYPAIFSTVIDHCEIYNMSGNSDLVRLTGEVQFTNSCIHDCSSNITALGIFHGPNIKVANNNFYNNNTRAILIVGNPDGSVQITDNNFTNNKVNFATSNCYKTPLIARNNFFSYTDYNVYCTDYYGYGPPGCAPIPNASYFTLDMRQNYFAYSSTAQLDSSIYDLYDNWVGRTIIAYDTSITTPYPNNPDCFNTSTSCIARAGADMIFCDYNLLSTHVGGTPAVLGGIPPYTYNWTAAYSSWDENDLLDDPTNPNPTLIDFPSDTFLTFHLTITDSSGNVCTDSVIVRNSSYSWTLDDKQAHINQGDSVQLYKSIYGGVPPFTYLWTPSTGLIDPTDFNTWAKPDTTTFYYLSVTDAGGCVGADTFQVFVTPVTSSNQRIITDFQVYPIPATDYLTIEGVKRESTFQLYDVLGTEVLQTKLHSETNTIEIKNLANGIYIYRVTGETKVGKVFIKK